MSIIIRLQNLPLTAKVADICEFFGDLKIPKSAVNIVGGPLGDAFIGFESDEDARLAMRFEGKLLHNSEIRLLLSSRREMDSVISNAHAMAAAAFCGGPKPAALAIDTKPVSKLAPSVEEPKMTPSMIPTTMTPLQQSPQKPFNEFLNVNSWLSNFNVEEAFAIAIAPKSAARSLSEPILSTHHFQSPQKSFNESMNVSPSWLCQLSQKKTVECNATAGCANGNECDPVYTYEELCQAYPDFCQQTDTELERFLSAGPYSDEDPVLVCSYNDTNLAARVVPNAQAVHQNKELIINSLIANGAERIADSDTAFFFSSWNILWAARKNLQNPLMPNNCWWAFSMPLSVSAAIAATGILAPVTPPCVGSIIIRTVTEESPGVRNPSRYLVDHAIQFFEL